MQRRQGFTLIELLVTSSVIAVVAAMAVPGFKNARNSTNEASTIMTLRSISLANETYRVRFGTYPNDLQALEDSGLVSENISELDQGVVRAGYAFTYTPTATTWTVTASPDEVGETGHRHFYIDVRGIVRFEEGATAGPTSTPIQ